MNHRKPLEFYHDDEFLYEIPHRGLVGTYQRYWFAILINVIHRRYKQTYRIFK